MGVLAIETRGLRYRYDDGTEALRGIDFRLECGESVALLGANGSGKTTFALCLLGLRKGEGYVSICGHILSDETGTEIRRKAGILFQDADAQLFMPTVIDDICFGPQQIGVPQAEALRRAADVLSKVGLNGCETKAPYHLSAGEKRRAALAGVLVMQPELLVLDEPTTHLDPPGRRELTRLLLELPQSKVVITHDTAFARAVTQRAVFFDQGLIAADGAVDDVVRKYRWDL